ncbi:hypothetical protein PF66_06198 [Pseudomonas asplenii]|uniref:Uncharacterized protein n=1 Tax=Pseudomonas asplenii TaxID=53407 RepID=A0A0M9GC45_9PSED|nr:hypothetical protein [Pseudomonas fuscovaginae]KPA87288.1 hypothetical protein PF66_06198 [Pseudomonas fuscovaginae]
MGTITSANSTFAIAITNLFPVPQSVQGYSSDSMFAMDAVDIAEVVMGADGKMSAGYIFNPQKQTVTIMPDSPSYSMFLLWANTMKAARDVYWANATIIMPAIKKKFTLKNGVMANFKAMPDAKKTLQAAEFHLTWESVTSEDYNG